jgi:hypothetical protein
MGENFADMRVDGIINPTSKNPISTRPVAELL